MARKLYALHGLHPELPETCNPIWEGNRWKRKIYLSGKGVVNKIRGGGVEARYDERVGTEKEIGRGIYGIQYTW